MDAIIVYFQLISSKSEFEIVIKLLYTFKSLFWPKFRSTLIIIRSEASRYNNFSVKIVQPSAVVGLYAGRLIREYVR